MNWKFTCVRNAFLLCMGLLWKDGNFRRMSFLWAATIEAHISSTEDKKLRSLKKVFHSEFFLRSSHTHRRGSEWERDFNAWRLQIPAKALPSIPNTIVLTPTTPMTVLVQRRDGVFVHGVLPATFTHRSILSVPAQLQLTHCQRRTAFSSNRFACHTFWVKKAIGFSPINTFPPDQLDTCNGEPKENISTWKTQIKTRNKSKKILIFIRRLEVNFNLRNLLFSYAARSFNEGMNE